MVGFTWPFTANALKKVSEMDIIRIVSNSTLMFISDFESDCQCLECKSHFDWCHKNVSFIKVIWPALVIFKLFFLGSWSVKYNLGLDWHFFNNNGVDVQLIVDFILIVSPLMYLPITISKFSLVLSYICSLERKDKDKVQIHFYLLLTLKIKTRKDDLCWSIPIS